MTNAVKQQKPSETRLPSVKARDENWWPEIMEQTATYYAELSKQPGWRDHCRHQVREMEASDSCWKGLLAMVQAKLARKQEPAA